MILENLPVLGTLSNQDYFIQLAESIVVPAGETLFQEGDVPQFLYVRVSGNCMLSRNARPLGEARSDQPLDLIAVLGDLPHSQRAITLTDCSFLRWQLVDLWQDAGFNQAASHYLAQRLQQVQSRLDQFQSPIHFQPRTAQIEPGPFSFMNSTIVFAFCTTQHDDLVMPPGVSRVGSGLLLGIADFPLARYVYNPDVHFAYTETTFFVPVRVGARLGLYVPYIYPSTYEPILLGREIYGFPKQPGETIVSDSRASLSVAGDEVLSVEWGSRERASEARIVGSFGQLYGVTGRITAAAFAIGDMLLNMMNVPFYRRVSVFNHKRIAGVDSTYAAPTYGIDQLTQAVFSVERWHTIDNLPDAGLQVTGRIFRDWGITLREAYCTRLNMRLSTGRVLRNYRAVNPDG